MKSKPGVWFATHEQIAHYVKANTKSQGRDSPYPARRIHGGDYRRGARRGDRQRRWGNSRSACWPARLAHPAIGAFARVRRTIPPLNWNRHIEDGDERVTFDEGTGYLRVGGVTTCTRAYRVADAGDVEDGRPGVPYEPSQIRARSSNDERLLWARSAARRVLESSLCTIQSRASCSSIYGRDQEAPRRAWLSSNGVRPS